MFRQIARLQSRGETFAIATIVDVEGSSPRKPGTRMVVLPKGRTLGSVGGGRLERMVKTACSNAMDTGEGALLTFGLEPEDGIMACGGKVKVFIEPVIPQRRLMIVGAGHVGRALSSAASFCGMKTLLADRNGEVFNRHHLDESVGQVAMEGAMEFFRDYPPRPTDFIVIATGSHEDDLIVLREALKTKASFVGLLGSRKKRDTFFKRLKDEGISDADLSRVACPVGLPIGAQGPEEIAISIMAEIIERSRKAE